jgi:hypothetical protein
VCLIKRRCERRDPKLVCLCADAANKSLEVKRDGALLGNRARASVLALQRREARPGQVVCPGQQFAVLASKKRAAQDMVDKSLSRSTGHELRRPPPVAHSSQEARPSAPVGD